MATALPVDLMTLYLSTFDAIINREFGLFSTTYRFFLINNLSTREVVGISTIFSLIQRIAVFWLQILSAGILGRNRPPEKETGAASGCTRMCRVTRPVPGPLDRRLWRYFFLPPPLPPPLLGGSSTTGGSGAA